jgi:hypothetical protein
MKSMQGMIMANELNTQKISRLAIEAHNQLLTEQRFADTIIALMESEAEAFDVGKLPNVELVYFLLKQKRDCLDLFNSDFKLALLRYLSEQHLAEHFIEDIIATKDLLSPRLESSYKALDNLSRERSVINEEQFRVSFIDYTEEFKQHTIAEYAYLLNILQTTPDVVLNIFDKNGKVDVYSISRNTREAAFQKVIEKAESYKLTTKTTDVTIVSSNGSAYKPNSQWESPCQIAIEMTKQQAIHTLKSYYFCYRELIRETPQNKLDYINKPLLCCRTCSIDYWQHLRLLIKLLGANTAAKYKK